MKSQAGDGTSRPETVLILARPQDENRRGTANFGDEVWKRTGRRGVILGRPMEPWSQVEFQNVPE